MWTRKPWAIFLAFVLLGAACGGDDEGDVTTTTGIEGPVTETDTTTTTTEPIDQATGVHECIISERYLRVMLDIETFWPFELLAELDVDWGRDFPDVFKDPELLLPGSVFLTIADGDTEFTVALAPDRSVVFSDGQTGTLEPGISGALEALLLDGDRVLLPAESLAPDGTVLPEGTTWSSDGNTVVLTRPADPPIVVSPLDEYLTGEYDPGEVIELSLPDDALLLSPGAVASRRGSSSGPAAPTGTRWYVEVGPSGIGSTTALAEMLDKLRKAIPAALDRQLAELLEQQVSPERDAAGAAEYVEAIAELRESYPALVDVEPVYAMAFEGHWSLEPGAEPFEPGASLEKPETLTMSPIDMSSQVVVAIVDSGFPVAHWAGLADVPMDDWDSQDQIGEESHGLFVASVIRQIAPSATILGARVEASGDGLVRLSASSAISLTQSQAAVLTDEDSVVLALERLFGEIVADGWPGLVVINLSLGTYACEAMTDIPPPNEVKRALVAFGDEATQHGTQVKIFAAAGNESLEYDDHDSDAFYPAAFAVADGVAALDSDGRLVTWDTNGDRIESDSNVAQLDHVQHVALGVDVVGAGRTVMGYWSGSSFATAAMSGLAAARNDADEAEQKCPSGVSYAKQNTNQSGERTYEDAVECRP